MRTRAAPAKAEGAGACPVAAALAGSVSGATKVVCVVSGGGLDRLKLVQILSGCPARHGLTPKQAECPRAKTSPGWLAAVAVAAAALLAVACVRLR